MSLLTFSKTVLGSMVKKPVTVQYPKQEQVRPERLRGHIENDMDVCILCGMCAKRCPALAIAVDRKGGYWQIDPYSCVACGECVIACPKNCLSMLGTKSEATTHKHAVVQTKPVEEKPAAGAAGAAAKPKPKVQLTPEQLERIAKAKAAKAAKDAAKAAEAKAAPAE